MTSNGYFKELGKSQNNMYKMVHICSKDLVDMYPYIRKYIKKQTGSMHTKLLISSTLDMKEELVWENHLGLKYFNL